MKLLTQIGIIFGICWISTCIERVLPFTLPASIIGMLLLLALLLARVIKTEHIREKSDYLLGNLPFFFIPASVSIINYADVLRENLLALVVVCAVSLIATFAATVGAVRLTCRLLERGKRRERAVGVPLFRGDADDPGLLGRLQNPEADRACDLQRPGAGGDDDYRGAGGV